MARIASESKAGYYATPPEELSLLCQKLRIDPNDTSTLIRIIDPCCGKGEALQQIANAIMGQGAMVKTYGVELEETRYIEAAKSLDYVIQDGMEQLRTQPVFALHWLNPPYADGFSERTELTFLRRLSSVKAGVLQKDGLLLFCIPQYVVKACAGVLSGRFRDFRIYRFTDRNYDVFKQVLVICKFGKGGKSKEDYAMLRAVGDGDKDMLPTLEEIEEDVLVPVVESEEPYYRAGKLNMNELQADLQTSSAFIEFEKRIGNAGNELVMKRPMLPLKPTHMGVAIAAGAVGGNLGHIVSGITKKLVEETPVFNEEGLQTGITTSYYYKSIVRVFNENGVFDLQ